MKAVLLILGLWPTLLLAWSEQDQDRFQALVEELRCLVCQNQSIADSAAPLAEDLRRQVREMMEAGRSDTEIRDYMVQRYGDFVLYRPPVKARTWALWFGPFVMLLFGALIVWRLRLRAADPEATPSPVDPAVVQAVLSGQSEPGKDKN